MRSFLFHLLPVFNHLMCTPFFGASSLTMNGAIASPQLEGTSQKSSMRSLEDVELLAATHVIYSYSGAEPPLELLNLTQQGKVGGIMLFGGNVDENLSINIEKIQQAYKMSPAYFGKPLLISTDQEGGYVKRIPGGPYESAKEAGQQRNPICAALQDGKDAGQTLKSQGVNVNLAPVLGVYRSESNFLNQFNRSYSNDTTIVSACGSSFIQSEQKVGIASTAKHFPGLGLAGSDTTDGVPMTINSTLKELREIDIVPFRNAISDGVDLVMVSWAFYDALDSSLPAGLSKKWVKGELRNEIGFEGVTITDAIEAGALISFGDDNERAILATQAGMDLISAGRRNVSQGLSIVKALSAKLADGSLPLQEFREATNRIQKLQIKLGA